MRRVQKNRLGARRGIQKPFHFVRIRPKLIFLSQRTIDSLGAASINIGPISWKMRAENQDRISGIKKRFTKELLEYFGARRDHNVRRGYLDAKFAPIIRGDYFSEFRQTR